MSKVFDSNILVYHLNHSLPPYANEMVAISLEEGAIVSVVSSIEVLGWPHHTDGTFAQAKKLLDQFQEQSLSSQIVSECINLRRQRTIKLPDAIIAATALHLQIPLVTRNTDDFKNIDNLTLINPFELPVVSTDTEETPSTDATSTEDAPSEDNSEA